MIIRGIDFARHTVVVGNDAETPQPNNVAGQANLPARGDVVARVVALAGGEATLDIAGQRVVVQTHVSLNLGDKLFVRVQQPQNGTLRLSILASEPDEEAGPPLLADRDIDSLLSDLDMPLDARTRMAARTLAARDGTLNKGALKDLLSSLKQFPQATQREAGAAALLQKAGVPVTPSTVNVIAQRAQPDAPPQLAQRLSALLPGLEALVKQVPARSPLATQVQEVLATLQGLPLDENATTETVVQALRGWIDKLQPKTTAAPAPKAAPAASAVTPAADDVIDTLARLSGTDEPALPSPAVLDGARGEVQADTPEPAAEQPPQGLPRLRIGGAPAENPAPDALPAKPPKQGLMRAEGVSPSQRPGVTLGITKEGPAPANDLASQLEKLGSSLGSEHKAVGQAIREAVAELRYTQLSNGPGPSGTGGEYLIPLFVPQLSPEHPEGRLQVFQRASRKGEPIDPNNVRFVFVLETEHLSTVQADMSIKDGQVELSIGVSEKGDREMVANHLEELQRAIADLGWPTGTFGARQARGLPPRTRQEEGLEEVVRFDRRV